MITRTKAEPLEGELGPALAALTPLRQRFVIAKVHGGLSDADAYRATGYTGENATNHAWRVAHDEGVQAAILEEARKLMRSQGPKSILTLVAIRDDAAAKPEVRIKAAVELLNRAGFHAVSEHHEHLSVHLSEGEMDRRILAMCAELGISEAEARKMLIAPGEFEKNSQGVYELPAAEPSKHALEIRRWRDRKAGKTPEEWEADKAQRRAEHAERLRAEYQAAQAARVTDIEDISDD